MNPYDMIRAHMMRTIPFATHTGVEITRITDGEAEAILPATPETQNHIATPHAGAVFTLGETASGAAMAGAIAPILLECRPVAAEASIKYLRLAKGQLTATGKTSIPGAEALSALKAEGRIQFDVNVSITDETGELVNEMTVAWHVKSG
ncbi:PaaI family thioesterase [Pontivivens insulae]|uniref:DUF4442 domain-containing protein n=1 Tax=Pontivivens insulae TaxID=1639689 RepID=A0A2R8A6L5_9RHOB|nr:PaaI family thioesterase [Pontivivens insulae]RED18001.1 uncharacterized protein (TIGR00369 family) [Pontivivens insulae]SPF27891.1 hypothetical protein POI8812_00186 [Pontivivens insulae]